MMNKLKFFLTFFIIITCLISCKKSSLQKEQQVFYALLPTLLDSVYEKRGSLLPPPDLKAAIIESKSHTFYLYNNTVSPSSSLQGELLKHFMLTDSVQISCSYSSYKISEQEINLEATSFKLACKIEPEDQETAVVTFSTVCLDSSLKFGALEADLYCGPKCGRSFIIFIKKVSGQWQIDTIENTGVS